MASMAPTQGPDVGKAPSLEEAAAAVKNRKKKSEKGVYRPKIQVDVVFKRSTPAAAAPKKRHPRKKKAGKQGLALGGEDSVVVGVAVGQVDGAGMEGVVLAGQRSVLLPEVGVGVGGRKVEGGGVEVEKKVEEGGGVDGEKKVGEVGEDGTPPPKPLSMGRRPTRTYLRRSGLNAKRCLDFGSGKCDDDQVLPVGVVEGEVIAVGEVRVREVIVGEGEEATVAFTRKPRTKRRAGSTKLNYAYPGERSSLLSKNKIFVSKSGGRGTKKAVRDDLLLHFHVRRKQRTLKGKRREVTRVAAEMEMVCCKVTTDDHLSTRVSRKQRTSKGKPRDMNKGPSGQGKMMEMLAKCSGQPGMVVNNTSIFSSDLNFHPPGLASQFDVAFPNEHFINLNYYGQSLGALRNTAECLSNVYGRRLVEPRETVDYLSGLGSQPSGLAKQVGGFECDEYVRNFHFTPSLLAKQVGGPLFDPVVLSHTFESSNNFNFNSFYSAEGGPLAEESSHGLPFAQARDQQLVMPNASLPPEPRDQQLVMPNASLPPEPQNAIVLFQKSARPKKPEVLLDEVSRIMWRLTENEGTLDMDTEMEERCRKEWAMFAGRVHKFIAVMSAELGPRSYSKWNGSVLDSVVGVFLTQNVSDNLSSEAFMCLAAQFPPQYATKDFDVHDSMEFECENLHKEGTNDNGTKPSYHNVCLNVDGNLKTKTKDVCGLSEEFQESSIKEYENLEHKATISNISIVLEGQTTKSEHDDGESNTASFDRKDEGCKLPNKGKEEVAKENSVDNKKNERVYWDGLRREACRNYPNQQKTLETLDSVDYTALRNATVEDVASAIKIRGMNNRIAARIQDVLNELVELHGSLDLEWLRSVTPQDKVQDYLLHFYGLGMKSVECVRLLTLQHQAFPVDTNVARICIRLGWVPLKPLPKFIQIHVLDKYPDMNKIQQYLWPRLRKLDPQTLYELHYQMITFGKVFCTKNRPNCRSCPLKEDCRHYASACASEKLALPSSGEKQQSPQKGHKALLNTMLLETTCDEDSSRPSVHEPAKYYVTFPDADDDELIGDLSQYVRTAESDLGLQDQETSNSPDDFVDDIEDFPGSLKTFPQKTLADLKDINLSNALVPLTLDAASTPEPKLKKLTRLRTEHYVYELPDDHPLLAKLEPRVANDSNPYLLAIWVAGETAQTIQTSMEPCIIRKSGDLCDEVTCFDCNNVREGKTQSTRGTFLIPCRTATRGRFPLNGTYFQINEVFADDETSRRPIDIPRNLLWNLQRRTVHFGSTITTLSRGFSREEVRNLFSKDYICLRGFDRITRFPKPLCPRFHCPVNKMKSTKPRKSSRNDNG